MKMMFIAIPITLIFFGCATTSENLEGKKTPSAQSTLNVTTGANFKGATKGFPKNLKANAKFGTLSKRTRKELGLDDSRGIVAVISEGNVIFYGEDGLGFTVNNKPPSGRIVNNINIKTYVNSPECEKIDDGSGSTFWYPWDCPH